MHRSRRLFTVGLLAACALLGGPAPAQQGMEDVQIETVEVADGVYMLVGRGGNIGVSVGEDGVLLIDDQFAPLTEKIQAAVAELSGEPIRFVVNTHWHGDHTGGNENLGKSGALIMAHDNVREKMSVEHFFESIDRRIPAAPEGALPVVTFTDTVTFHYNDEEIHAFHVPEAHTDGDTLIHFKQANVLHMGDIFFNGLYPFIDVQSGGSVDGVIAAVDRALDLADAETKIIAGHGPLSNHEELATYHQFLITVRSRVATHIRTGKSLEETVAAKPSAEWDEVWGGAFINPEQLITSIYQSLTR